MSIDLTEVVNDTDLAESFTITRSTGQFAAGGWIETTKTVKMYGVITAPEGEDLQMIPEADEVEGAIAVYSSQQIFETHLDSEKGQDQGTSDVILWQGFQYRVIKAWRYNTRGFWKAIAARMLGA